MYDAPYRSGIYFLLLDDIIFYVGLSKNVCNRIIAHQRDGKPFRAFTCIDVPDDLLAPVEAFYIHAFDPPWNTDVPDDEWGVMDLVKAARRGHLRLPGMPSHYRLPDPPGYEIWADHALQKPWGLEVRFQSSPDMGWTTFYRDQPELWL